MTKTWFFYHFIFSPSNPYFIQLYQLCLACCLIGAFTERVRLHREPPPLSAPRPVRFAREAPAVTDNPYENLTLLSDSSWTRYPEALFRAIFRSSPSPGGNVIYNPLFTTASFSCPGKTELYLYLYSKFMYSDGAATTAWNNENFVSSVTL